MMTSAKFTVVAAGRAYTDIVAHVTLSFLNKYNIPVDGQRECSVDELTQIQSRLSEAMMFVGGPSANTVAIISNLGGRAGFFGKVYHDKVGDHFLEDLRVRKIELCCDPFATEVNMSGKCLVLLTGEKRSFVYYPGCANYFSAADFEKFDFSMTKFFLVEAHLLTHVIAMKAIEAALQLAIDQCQIVINLQGILFWDNKEVIELIVSTANIIIGNKAEQQAFSMARNRFDIPLSKSKMIVTTHGKAGAEANQSESSWHVPANLPQKLVSTVGAGDAFIGGFLFALSQGKSVEECLHSAVSTAAGILEEVGARPLA